MGCGGSQLQKKDPLVAPPVKGNPNDNAKPDPEEYSMSSDEDDGYDRKKSKSVSRLEALGYKDDDEPEMFFWGDFVVDVNQATKKAPTAKRNPRQPPKQKRSSMTDCLDGVFVYGDFTVSMENDDADRQNPSLNVVQKKDLSQYHIKAYDIYSLVGHSARVKCICVSPNESFFISCSNEEASMTMCQIESGKEIMSFMGHDDTIISACFSNDAKYLATTSRDNTMILWDVTTGKNTLTFEHEKVVICCCFSRDSKLLVSGCQDKVCRVWETKKGREMNCYMDHDGIIISISFAPDGNSAVSASADKTLRIWKAADASPIHTLKGHTGIVLSCAYRSDGKYIVSNDERILRVWDASNGSCTLSLSVDEVPRPNTLPGKKQTWTLSSYCPGPLGFYIIAACNSKTIHVFHPETGEEILAYYCKAPVYCLSCGSHSKVAIGDSVGNVFIVTLHAA